LTTLQPILVKSSMLLQNLFLRCCCCLVTGQVLFRVYI